MNDLSRLLYRVARLTRDLNAVQRGPSAMAKRLVRRTVYRQVNRGTARVLRWFL